MSASAIGFSDTRAARFWNATVGKKAVMALSGIVLFLFICGHLVGNLQVFEGPEKFNAYAKLLRVEPLLLWAVRGVLLVMVTLHVWASIQLALLNKLEARPIGYVKKKAIGSTYASRTMYWSGPIIGTFVIYHLMQFTLGIGGTPFEEGMAYQNLVRGFQVPFVSIFCSRHSASIIRATRRCFAPSRRSWRSCCFSASVPSRWPSLRELFRNHATRFQNSLRSH